MLEMMSENLQLSFVKPRKNDGKSDFKEIEAKALDRWRGIICFLLNIDTKDEEESLRPKQREIYYELLTHADYMDKH